MEIAERSCSIPANSTVCEGTVTLAQLARVRLAEQTRHHGSRLLVETPVGSVRREWVVASMLTCNRLIAAGLARPWLVYRRHHSHNHGCETIFALLYYVPKTQASSVGVQAWQSRLRELHEHRVRLLAAVVLRYGPGPPKSLPPETGMFRRRPARCETDNSPRILQRELPASVGTTVGIS